MDDKTIASAVKHYEALRKAQAKYYQTNREEICEKRRQARAEWRETHPPKPRGRPPKT